MSINKENVYSAFLWWRNPQTPLFKLRSVCWTWFVSQDDVPHGLQMESVVSPHIFEGRGPTAAARSPNRQPLNDVTCLAHKPPPLLRGFCTVWQHLHETLFHGGSMSMVKVLNNNSAPWSGTVQPAPLQPPPCVIPTTGSPFPEGLVGTVCRQINCPDHDSLLLESAFLGAWICSLRARNSLYSL